MAQSLSVRLLGQFLLSSQDEVASARPNRSPRLQALVGYLILHRGAPVQRSHLAFVLWPDSAEPQALTNLRNLFHQLRQAVRDPDLYLRADSRTLAWIADSPASVDVVDFENHVALAAGAVSAGNTPQAIALLRAAAESYRGDLLPSCYEDWVEADRARLRQLFLEAMDRLVRLLVAAGDVEGAVPYAQQLVRYDPLHEEGYRHLLEVYAATGDRIAARRIYQSLVAVLERELDAEPSPTTRMAFERSQTAPPPEARPAVPEPAARRVPLLLSSFVGRDAELAALARCLAASRLVTLTGAGGSGKTRLALQAAGRMASGAGGAVSGAGGAASGAGGAVSAAGGAGHEASGAGGESEGAMAEGAQRFAGRVWWVDLAPVSAADFVGAAFLNALEAARGGHPSDAAAIAAHMAGAPALVVVDNCEHVIEACAKVVEEALLLCPSLAVLATSREPLGVPGETVLAVKPLPLPPRDWLRSAHPEHVPDAVALFAERAASALPTFVLDDSNSATVASICRRVDGLPLAIELAAAAVRVLGVDEIARRIDAQMELPGRLRGGPARHRTLREAIEWSYSRLSAGEKDLFGQLAVFAGVFDLPAVEAVCAASAPHNDLLDLLALLVDKSLVVVEERGGRTEYRLLDSLRAFARTALGAADDEDAPVHRRHAEWCLQTVETGHPRREADSDEAAWLDRVELCEDDIRAAMRWAADRPERAETLARLATGMMMYWNVRERRAEARTWLEIVIAQGDSVPKMLRARALREAGGHAINVGQYDVARRYLKHALVLHEAAGDVKGQAGVLVAMSGLASNMCRFQEAEHLATRSLELYTASEYPAGMATCVTKLGHLAFVQGRYADAHLHFERALELRRKGGLRWLTADCLTYMAELAVAEGDYDRALALCDEIEPLCAEVGDAIGPVELVSVRARVAVASSDVEDALATVTQALQASVELGDTYLIGQCHLTAAALESRRGNHPEARTHLQAAIDHFERVQDSPGLAECGELAGHLAARRGDHAEAVRLYASAEAWRRSVGAPAVPAVAVQRDLDLQEARSVLTEAAYREAEAKRASDPLGTVASTMLP